MILQEDMGEMGVDLLRKFGFLVKKVDWLIKLIELIG
jgi:hypothetical protein